MEDGARMQPDVAIARVADIAIRNIPDTEKTMTLLTTVSLLVLSNAFMTLAWYGHLRFLSVPLWVAILGSWGIALIEYCFQVPANRLGYHAFSAYELKTMQEIITLFIFIVFAAVYLGEGLKPKHLAGFLLLVLAAWTIFQDSYGVEW